MTPRRSIAGPATLSAHDDASDEVVHYCIADARGGSLEQAITVSIPIRIALSRLEAVER